MTYKVSGMTELERGNDLTSTSAEVSDDSIIPLTPSTLHHDVVRRINSY
jgi:hypothetical protein